MQEASPFIAKIRFLACLAGGLAVCAMPGLRAAAPTGIVVTPAFTTENLPPDTVVATLSAVDADEGDSHVFTFVSGAGSLDNGGFSISGNQLSVPYGVTLDYDVIPRDLLIRLKVTDSTSGTFEQAIAISVIDDRTEDADGDGLSEGDEEDLYGTSDFLFDSDADGFGDAAELAAIPPTSPSDPDDWPDDSIIVWGNSGQVAAPAISDAGIVTLATGQNHSLALKAGGLVEAWGGANAFGQIVVPPDLGNVVAVDAGGDHWFDDSAHSLALKSNGTVIDWGYDHGGKIAVPAGLDQVIAIAAGRAHGLALRADGTVAAWGHNPHGGVEPPAGLTDVVAVSSGGHFSLALKSDGTLVTWGSNFDGAKWVDATTPAGLRDVVAISAGRFHSLALQYDGGVVAWGLNSHGQSNVPAGLTDVVAVAAGGFHSVALKRDGSVVAWGSNTHGQAVVPGAATTGVKLISAGILHSLAVLQGDNDPAITSSPLISALPNVEINHQITVTNATVFGFSALGLPPGLWIDPLTGLISGISGPARNSALVQVETDKGKLTQSVWIGIAEGLPPTSVSLTPAAVMENHAAGTVVGTLSAADPDLGDAHTFEWVDGPGSTDNKWFRIEGDQLIVDQTITRDFEQNSAGFSIRVRARDASLNPFEQTIAIQFLDDRGEDADGDGLTEAQEEDVYLTLDSKADTDGDGFGDGFEVARGFSATDPAISPNGRIVLAWGNSADGRTMVPGGMENVIDLSAGSVHSLALKSDGTVLAWGGDGDGQCAVPEGLTGVIAVEAGEIHSLALKSDGTVSAWGDNHLGQTLVPEGLAGVVAIAAGGYHNLALKNDGTVVAWGADTDGQATVPAGLTDVVAVAAGALHSMVLKSDGTVLVWGSTADGVTTVPDGLGGVIGIAAGGFHCLALKHDGTVAAWGSNLHGQSIVPTNLANVTALSAGRFHSLALMADGTMAAWGDDTIGQRNIPLEARQIRKIEAGDEHNLAIRQSSGFPAFADLSAVRCWPGETLSKTLQINNATPSGFTAMGLPAGLVLDPVSGLVSGTVLTGERRAVRVSATTEQGTISRVIWFNTVDGIAPTDIVLSPATLAENSPAGTVVGSFSAVDSNAGDSHIFSLVDDAGLTDAYRFIMSGNQLLLRNPLAANFDAGVTQLAIRVLAVDSAYNRFERNIVVQLTDDRMEDADGDGINEATEEDVLGSSDSVFDNFNTSDADRDGVPGLLEHAFNLDPKVAGLPVKLVPGAGLTAGLPAVDLVPDGQGGLRLRIEYLRRVGAGLIYTPQFAGDMDWAAATNPVSVTPVGDGLEWERCVVEDSHATTSSARRFGRVKVSW